MRNTCPSCEKENSLEKVCDVEALEVRGELIEVDVEYYKCFTCSEELEDPSSDYDPVDVAYREYRRRHDMIQPEEIKSFRNRYGLTQNAVSKLLGWGAATLSRYENGALQDETHDKALRMAMEPRNLLKLIQESPGVLSEEKRNRLTRELKEAEEESYSFERIFEERFGEYEPTVWSGYKRIDLHKLFNAILFFCREGDFRTKLNKLLFYADFLHFKENTVSITGIKYAHMPFGPAPDNYTYYFAKLVEDGSLRVEEHSFSDDIIADKLVSKVEPDLTIFSDSELKILITIKQHFKDLSSGGISHFVHQERAYVETQDGELISYEYANELQL